MDEADTGLKIHCRIVSSLLVDFIAGETRKTGRSRVVVGLSGGLDSAVAACLASRALGPENVICALLPYRTSSAESLTDARKVIRKIGAQSVQIEITPMVDAYFSRFPEADPVRRGNKMARERMSVLYDLSSLHAGLVLGTSNKTELLLGYGTIHGDIASAINPLGDLYKTQVRQLADFLELPENVRKKTPSADLWPDQSDETELGFSYERLDRFLYLLVDRRAKRGTLLEAGFSADQVKILLERVRSSQFKRRLPLVAKLSTRTIGIDFRYPRDWGL